MARVILYAIALSLATAAAHAHAGVGAGVGIDHGFSHPLGGIDHVLAMVAVGLLAARLGGRALWLVSLAFVSMMAAGGALAMAGMHMPFVEIGIALSVVVFGATVALGFPLPIAAAMALVGAFALLHGHAHGAEMPEAMSGLAYGVGFVLATAALQAAGVALGLAIGRLGEARGARLFRACGSVVGVVGITILAGAL